MGWQSADACKSVQVGGQGSGAEGFVVVVCQKRLGQSWA